MNAFAVMTWLQLKLSFRNHQNTFWTLLFPVVMVFLLGSLFGHQQIAQVHYVILLVPNRTAMTMGSVSFMGLGVSVATYRERRLLRTYQATPLGALRFIGALTLPALLMVCLSLAVTYTAGAIGFGISLPLHPFGVLGGILLSAAALFPLGLFCTTFNSTMQGAAGLSLLAFNVQAFFAGGLLPYSLLPTPLQMFAKAMPLHYVSDLLTMAWAGQAVNSLGLDLLILILISLLFSFLSIKYFHWT